MAPSGLRRCECNVVAALFLSVFIVALSNAHGFARGARLATSVERTPLPDGYKGWDYTAKICSAAGACRESADTPTPRTRFSTTSRAQYERWWLTHDWMRANASRAAQPDLILVGDSITEAYVGTSMLHPVARCRGVPEALATELGGAFPRGQLVAAISGDQTQHVLWRLAHGGGLPLHLRGSGALISLHIGTNNLGAGFLPADAALGVRAIARWLLRNTQSRVLVNALLPRSDTGPLGFICPPRCAASGRPHASFRPAVAKANAHIAQHVEELGREFRGRVALADCGRVLTDAAGEASKELMPDRLHPNAKGHALLLRCLRPHMLALTRRNASRATVVGGR